MMNDDFFANGLDLSDASANQGGVDPGEHEVTVKNAELKVTKSGTGRYINVDFITNNGQHIFHMFNIVNENPKAVMIGRNQLKAFLTCAGYADPNNLKDVWDLINLKCIVKVKMEESTAFGDKPKITVFKPLTKASLPNKEASKTSF